jgi:tyrosyl-tRNA synthetase
MLIEEFVNTFGGYTEITSQTHIIEALVASKLASSKGEAKRLFHGKTVRINSFNSDAVNEEKYLTELDCSKDEAGKFLFLMVGKKVRIVRIGPRGQSISRVANPGRSASSVAP